MRATENPAATKVLAMGCHPDDIEFMMAGTLLLLKNLGAQLHYINIANGSCGTTQYSRDQIVRIRRRESKNAAQCLGAVYHESLVEDLEVFYTPELVRKTTAVVREVAPDILLLLSPEDYMEDHMNSARVGVTAGFCRGMPNYQTDPPCEPTYQDIVLYHALPYGLQDGMRRTIQPDFYVDISTVLTEKETALACHESQKRWLDESQGLNSYLITMKEMSAAVGAMSGSYSYAEGWRRHAHLGYSTQEYDPLEKLLSGYCKPCDSKA